QPPAEGGTGLRVEGAGADVDGGAVGGPQFHHVGDLDVVAALDQRVGREFLDRVLGGHGQFAPGGERGVVRRGVDAHGAVVDGEGVTAQVEDVLAVGDFLAVGDVLAVGDFLAVGERRRGRRARRGGG